MRRLVVFLLILSTLPWALCECGGTAEREFLPQLDDTFCYELSGSFCDVDMCAVVRAEVPRETENGRVRAVSLTFRSPESLRGITVTCDSFLMDTHEVGAVTVTLDGVNIENSALRGFLAPALLLAAKFETTASATATRDGQTVTLLSAESSDNSRAVGIADGQIVWLEGEFDGLWGQWKVRIDGAGGTTGRSLF